MNPSRRSFLLCSASALGTLQFGGSRALAAEPVRELMREPMRITHFDNIPPFSWADDRHEMRGVFIDVLDEAPQRRLGIPLVHLGYPWVRAQKMVMDGEADAYVTVPTPERRAYVDVSDEAIMTVTFRMYAQRNSPVVERLKNVKSVDDLKGFVVAAYIGAGWAREKLAGMQVDWAPNLDSVLKKLANGRNDVFVSASEVQRKRIKALGLEDRLIELPQALDTQTYSLCVRKTSRHIAILPRFDKVMRQMRDDGSLAAIYRKYDVLPTGKNNAHTTFAHCQALGHIHPPRNLCIRGNSPYSEIQPALQSMPVQAPRHRGRKPFFGPSCASADPEVAYTWK